MPKTSLPRSWPTVVRAPSNIATCSTSFFYWEGRLDEMRRLVQERWSTSPNRVGDLRSLWQIDSAVVMIDLIGAEVERAAQEGRRTTTASGSRVPTSPCFEDGFPKPARWLDACLKRRPDDPVVWRARLRWARATDSLVEARRAVAHLPAERFSRTELLALRAWFAAREGRADQERIALEQLIEHAPGDTQALERLAVLTAELGQADRATELRRRKAGIDRAKEKYTRPAACFRQGDHAVC